MRCSSIARRVLVTGGVVLAFLVGAAVAPGDPGNGAVRIPAPIQGRDLGPQVCGFPIHFEPIVNNQYLIHDTTLPDGTEIQQFTGNLVVRFTNLDTGKTIVENASGPGTYTFYPDGSFLTDLHGLNFFEFGPHGQANTGEPGLVFTSGHVVVFFDGMFVRSFTLSGHQENGCELLS
jgi:hypothetical protein